MDYEQKMQRLRVVTYRTRRVMGWVTLLLFLPFSWFTAGLWLYFDYKVDFAYGYLPSTIVVGAVLLIQPFTVSTIRSFFDPAKCGLPS